MTHSSQNIEQLFFASKGKPVDYNGRLIQMVDCILVTDGQELQLRFESVASKWRQGVMLSLDGDFTIAGQTIPKRIALWQDTAPPVVHLQVQPKRKRKPGECFVKNVWDTGNGVVQSWHNGAAMIVTQLDRGRRYQCNEGLPDDDFDDIVFSVSW